MPRCKNCDTKFEKRYPNQMGALSFCLESDECTEAFWKAVKEKRIKDAQKKKRQFKKDNETVQELMKRAQKVFNEYIRLRDKGKPCISCNGKLGAKYDAGHYVSSGSSKALTFDENNVHAQCVACNQHKHGNLISYREGLIERIGLVWVQHLELRRHDSIKYTRNELQQIITEYKQKVKNLK